MIRTGPRFTEAARAAAAQKRRERAAIKAETKSNLEVFVLRNDELPNQYGWAIRQFGGVVVSRSSEQYDSLSQARAGGLKALELMPAALDWPIAHRRSHPQAMAAGRV